VALALVSILFFLSLVVIAVLFVVNLREMGENRRHTEAIENRLDSSGPAGARISAAYSRAIYLLVEREASVERGICTAFAVRPDLLATNAHCVLAMERGRAQGYAYFALPNGAAAERLPVTRMWRHPSYRSDADHPTEDVGLAEVSGTTALQVQLADSAQLASLGSGEEIYVYGFPGDLANTTSPVATITGGVIGRMTAFDGTGAEHSRAQLIQHSAFTSAGTSGSPIFNHHGAVVGVNAGTFRSAQRVEVVGPTGPQHQTVVTESGYKYGVRADLVAGLLAGLNR
jgi:V8-like Glu-specific endopeptidase